MFNNLMTGTNKVLGFKGANIAAIDFSRKKVSRDDTMYWQIANIYVSKLSGIEGLRFSYKTIGDKITPSYMFEFTNGEVVVKLTSFSPEEITDDTFRDYVDLEPIFEEAGLEFSIYNVNEYLKNIKVLYPIDIYEIGYILLDTTYGSDPDIVSTYISKIEGYRNAYEEDEEMTDNYMDTASILGNQRDSIKLKEIMDIEVLQASYETSSFLGEPYFTKLRLGTTTRIKSLMSFNTDILKMAFEGTAWQRNLDDFGGEYAEVLNRISKDLDIDLTLSSTQEQNINLGSYSYQGSTYPYLCTEINTPEISTYLGYNLGDDLDSEPRWDRIWINPLEDDVKPLALIYMDTYTAYTA